MEVVANEIFADTLPYYGESSHAGPLTREFWAVFAKYFFNSMNPKDLMGQEQPF